MIFLWIGMVEYIPCYSAPAEHWGLLPATRLASREILIEQNIKKRTGPALCVLCGVNYSNAEVVCCVYIGRGVHRIHRTVHNNSPRTVRKDTVRKKIGGLQRYGPQLTVLYFFVV